MKQYWKDYVLLKDRECIDYFQNNTNVGKTLMILGRGFDERMCAGIALIHGVIKELDIWQIRFREAKNSNSERYKEKVEQNQGKLKEVAGKCKIEEKEIDMWSDEGGSEHSVAEIRTMKFVRNHQTEIAAYDSVILDVSAMPQSIYFLLLDELLTAFYPEKQIFVLATENYNVDKITNPVGLEEEAHYFMKYGASKTVQDKAEKPVIWMPVLGECSEERLSKCYKCIMQTATYKEICPILPFPSLNERRADEIIMKYRKLLFGSWEVEKKNIIYASETNPFQVYRRICETVDHYSKVLMALNNTQRETESSSFAFSAMTSKLMSVGTFLAAYNLRREKYDVMIVGLNNRGYKLEKLESKNQAENVVYCLCLSDDGMNF